MAHNTGKSSRRQHLGRRGEDVATQMLKTRGYHVIERNWRCGIGEIDLVAEHEGVRVFVEVRTRRGTEFGTPEESITPKKQSKLIETAMTYLSQQGLTDVDWRIDVVAIEVGSDGRVRRVTVIQNAVQGNE